MYCKRKISGGQLSSLGLKFKMITLRILLMLLMVRFTELICGLVSMITWKKVNLFTQNLKSQYFSKVGILHNLMEELWKTASQSTTKNGTILIVQVLCVSYAKHILIDANKR